MTQQVTDPPRTPEWLPDLAIGLVLAGYGVVELVRAPLDPAYALPRALVVAGMATAAALYRRAPGAALALVWAACAIQVVSGIGVLDVQLAVVLVAFGAARYGGTSVLWCSGLSIPLGALAAVLYALRDGYSVGIPTDLPRSAYLIPHGVLLVIGGLVVITTLAVPWLLGLLLRSRTDTRRSQAERQVAEHRRADAEAAREQATEIARLRAEQTQLANDVHDVVGHSLAVILAQAESAQYLPPGDTARIQETFANIAGSARESLGDVRRVLAGTTDRRSEAPSAGLDSLIDGVRAAGNQVRSEVVGTPQPLPPELDAVAFRVLQEMLTNALKHGRRGEPVAVEQHWEGDLRIEVRNVVGEPAAGGTGLGVEGMRRRLESVGGRLDVRRRAEPVGLTYTATAWVPLRPVGRG